MKKSMPLVLTLVFALLLAGCVFAEIIVTIRPAKMVITTNVTEGFITTEEGYFFVENRNNFSAEIMINMTGDLSGLMSVAEDSFVLQPNETKKVYFNLSLTEPGNYTGDVLAAFRPIDAEEQNAGIAMQVLVFAREGSCTNCAALPGQTANQTGGTEMPEVDSNIMIVVIVVIAAISTAYLLHKRK